MKGLQLAEKFYLEYGKPMLEREFGDYLERIAVGLVGHGSECFGFDDEVSTDHDYGAGFCIWIPKADDQKYGFRLFRAYSELPREYMGVSVKEKSAFGSGNVGVHTIEDFYDAYTGGRLPENNVDWLLTSDADLAEATNGKVFCDNLGEFTRIREYLLNGRPEDVRLKKLASALFYMAQAGQYNYTRCIKRGERVAASLALTEFVKRAMNAAFLLNRKYAPYYKWTFRALKGLDELSDMAVDVEKLQAAPYDADENARIIEKICAAVVDHLVDYGYVQRKGDYLEPYAYAVNDLIRDGDLRNTPVTI